LAGKTTTNKQKTTNIEPCKIGIKMGKTVTFALNILEFMMRRI
jgi:hypothetical protein